MGTASIIYIPNTNQIISIARPRITPGRNTDAFCRIFGLIPPTAEICNAIPGRSSISTPEIQYSFSKRKTGGDLRRGTGSIITGIDIIKIIITRIAGSGPYDR